MNRKLMACAVLGVAALPLSADPPISLVPIGKYVTGIANLGAAEIAAFDSVSQRLFSVIGAADTLDVIDLSNPAIPLLVASVAISSCAPGGLPTSVAVRDGIVAVAAENAIDADPGWAVFFDTQGQCLNALTVGAGPDTITFTPTVAACSLPTRERRGLPGILPDRSRSST